MHTIGLTGGIGSGKSTVAALFEKCGAMIIDTDQLSRSLTQVGQPALRQIIQQFGPTIALEDGSLNRASLRKIIFSDEKHRIWLENLLHPLIRLEMQKIIKSSSAPYCIAVIPLLLETKPNPLIERILVVDTTPELQLHRTKMRDQTSYDEVMAIINTQVDRNTRLKKADDVITNNGSFEDLAMQVKQLDNFYRSLYE